MNIDMGYGLDVAAQVHRSLAERFGPYEDIRDVIVKRNPKVFVKGHKAYENEWIRDPWPKDNIPADFFVQAWGSVRPDSLPAKLPKIRENTLLHSLIWTLVAHQAVLYHHDKVCQLKFGSKSWNWHLHQAIQSSARMGAHFEAARLNGFKHYASKAMYWNKGGLEAARLNFARDQWLNEQFKKLNKGRAKPLTRNGAQHTLKDMLDEHIDAMDHPKWSPVEPDTIRTDILRK